MNYFLVFLGGGLGATARYWLQAWVYRFAGASFPYGTLLVNVLGCLCIGFFMAVAESRVIMHPAWRVFFAIGVLGGFTTFSSFSFETLALLRDGEFMIGSVNIVANVVTCLTLTWCGLALGKLLVQ